jgi:hypothetical protein
MPGDRRATDIAQKVVRDLNARYNDTYLISIKLALWMNLAHELADAGINISQLIIDISPDVEPESYH